MPLPMAMRWQARILSAAWEPDWHSPAIPIEPEPHPAAAAV